MAVSVSKDHNWIVCATDSGTSVWDAGLREKVSDVGGRTQLQSMSPQTRRGLPLVKTLRLGKTSSSQ